MLPLALRAKTQSAPTVALPRAVGSTYTPQPLPSSPPLILWSRMVQAARVGSPSSMTYRPQMELPHTSQSSRRPLVPTPLITSPAPFPSWILRRCRGGQGGEGREGQEEGGGEGSVDFREERERGKKQFVILRRRREGQEGGRGGGGRMTEGR